MYNIYIALYHPEDNTYSFPYYIDEYDKFESEERINMDNTLQTISVREGKVHL